MIALDTNILVYAHRGEVPEHELALGALTELLTSERRVAIPWPCLQEAIGVLTHPKIFVPPSSLTEAFGVVTSVVELPQVSVIGETHNHLDLLHGLMESPRVRGPKLHDARIAAICIGHGVDELWTADRDFSLFPALKTRNPLVRPTEL